MQGWTMTSVSLVPGETTPRRLEQVLVQLVERTQELRAALDDFDEASRKGLGLVHSEVRLVDALVETQAGQTRARLNKALDDFEKVRKELRLVMAELAIEEGASLAELAKALGVSRQLLSRLAIEARTPTEA